MIGKKIPQGLYIFLGIYTLLIFILSIFIQKYFVRKGTNIFINILCIFLLFAIIMMLLIFPLDLFSNFLFTNKDKNKNKTKLFSAFLYWVFYALGFFILDQIRAYISNGNFTFLSKIKSIIKSLSLFLIFYIGIGVVLDLLIRLFIHISGENNFWIITLKIIKAIVNIPMLCLYLMFLGCAIWNVPKDLFMKFHYPLRLKKLCWEITHVMRKYREEIKFIIISLNGLRLTKQKMENLDIAYLNEKIKKAKQKLKFNTNKRYKKSLKNDYEKLKGTKELFYSQKYIDEMIEKLKKTAEIFRINVEEEIRSIEPDENKTLINKNELVDINAKYIIFRGQIFRLNYQKYKIYKEWAEIKTFLLEKNSKNNKIKNKAIMKIEKSENLEILGNIAKILNKKHADSLINNRQAKENSNNNIIKNIFEKSKNKRNLKFNIIHESSYTIEGKEKSINLNNTEEINIKNNNKIQFKKIKLTTKTIIYYKIMPILSIILFFIILFYDILIIFGEMEYTFEWDIFAGKILRKIYTNINIITPIRILPMYFTLFVVAYDFGKINSDLIFCLYGNKQTEPSHMIFFVGMLSKFICPLCFNFIGIMFKGFKNLDLEGNKSKITLFFVDQFGYLTKQNDSIIIYIVKLALLFLFLKAYICSAFGIYANYAYKKYRYITYNANYPQKQKEIIMGNLILNNLNQYYGNNFKQFKDDNIYEYVEKSI